MANSELFGRIPRGKVGKFRPFRSISDKGWRIPRVQVGEFRCLKKGLANSDTFRTNSEDLKTFGRIQTPFGRITRARLLEPGRLLYFENFSILDVY